MVVIHPAQIIAAGTAGIVAGVAVQKPIRNELIDRVPTLVLRRRIILVPRPLAKVFRRILSLGIEVDILRGILRLVGRRLRGPHTVTGSRLPRQRTHPHS